MVFVTENPEMSIFPQASLGNSRGHGPAPQETPSASWGIVPSIPGLAPGASNKFKQANNSTIF